MWKRSDENCPGCKNPTQIFIHGDYSCGERCSNCKWQINFHPIVRRVRYGSKIDLPTIY